VALRDFIEPESTFEDDQTVATFRSTTWMTTVALREVRLCIECLATRSATLSAMGRGPAHEVIDAGAVIVAFEQVDPNPD
jgi:hypothetical protein